MGGKSQEIYGGPETQVGVCGEDPEGSLELKQMEGT